MNDAPVLTGTQATLAAGTEDTSYTINTADLLAGFTDVDGDTLSVSGLTANHGSLVDNGDGTWTFTPAANYNGPVSLSYNVIDGHGGSVAATQSFNLAAVNDAPVLTGTQATLAAGTEDTDLHDQRLRPARRLHRCRRRHAVGLRADGRPRLAGRQRRRHLDLHAGRQLQRPGQPQLQRHRRQRRQRRGDAELQPGGGERCAGPDRDAGDAGGRDRGHELHDQHRRPARRLHRCRRRHAVGLRADGQPRLAGRQRRRHLDLHAGRQLQRPGQPQLQRHRRQRRQRRGDQSFSLAAVNDAPVLTGTQAALAAGTEDTSYTINAADLLAGFTDVDGDTLSVSGLTADHGALVDNGDGTWTFTPAANYNGAVSLSYNVIDSNGGSVAATQSFNLAAVNDAPTAVVLSNTVTSTPENGGSIKVADIAVTDVNSGTNVLSLSGADALSLLDLEMARCTSTAARTSRPRRATT